MMEDQRYQGLLAAAFAYSHITANPKRPIMQFSLSYLPLSTELVIPLLLLVIRRRRRGLLLGEVLAIKRTRAVQL